MKPIHILTAALASTAFLHADESIKKESSSSSTVTTTKDGTATVIITVNGKTETRTFPLSESSHNITVSSADGTATAKVGTGHPKPTYQINATEKRNWIGIATNDVDDSLRAHLALQPEEGILVSHVAKDSPAVQAGIEENDILTRYNDQILVSPSQLASLVRMGKPGDIVRLSLLRKGEKREVNVKLEETTRPDFHSTKHKLPIAPDKVDKKRDTNPQGHIFTQPPNKSGIVIESKILKIGPDGTMEIIDDGHRKNDPLEIARKHLDQSNLTPEQREQILDALRKATKAKESPKATPSKNP